MVAGNIDLAEKDFIQALELTNNEEPVAHFYYAFLLNARGKYEEAVEHYTLAIENFDKKRTLSENGKKVDEWVGKLESMRRTTRMKTTEWKIKRSNFFGTNVRKSHIQ
jgi:tetratricopeptide (TPR) repeat protein